VLNNKCANCGGMYEYSPADKALKCIKCGAIKKIQTTFNVPAHEYVEGEDKFDNSWAKEVRHVKCKSCGAEVVFNKYAIVNQCSYCGNTALVNIKENTAMTPDAVIPFKFDKNQALVHFQEGLRKKLFIPNALKKKAPDVNLSSNYMGAYVFSGSATVKYSGVLEYETTTRDSNGHTSTEYHSKRVNGSLKHVFKNKMYECSDNLIQQELVEIMPYEIMEINGYKPEYLLGSMAEYSNMSVKDANIQLERDLKKEIGRIILNKYHCDRIKTLNLTFEYDEKKYIYTLLPVYIFNYNYKKKQYKTVMNGQTGKLGGNVPRSTLKILLMILFIMLFIGTILGVILF